MMLLNGQPLAGTERVRENIVFRPGNPNTFAKPNMSWAGLCIHWTGAENPSTRVIKTLETRGLSVQFVVEADGTIVQCADLSTRCAHMGSPGNDRFLGVEVVCRGFATRSDESEARRLDPDLRVREYLDYEVKRDMYRDVIGDRSIRMVGFNPAQVDSLVWLCETLAALYKFPKIIPCKEVSWKETELSLLPFPNPDDYVVSDREGRRWIPSFVRKPNYLLGHARRFTGVLGHCHTHKVKNDPGSQIFYRLWAEGWNPRGEKLST